MASILQPDLNGRHDVDSLALRPDVSFIRELSLQKPTSSYPISILTHDHGLGSFFRLMPGRSRCGSLRVAEALGFDVRAVALLQAAIEAGLSAVAVQAAPDDGSGSSEDLEQ